MNAHIDRKKIAFLHRTILLVHALILLLLIASCTSSIDKSKSVISVSIIPQKYFFEKIAGDRFHINVLIPPGASPAVYDPTPAQIAELSKSKVYFKIGYIEFEKNWIDKISKEYPRLIIVDNSAGIDLLGSTDHYHGHDFGSVEPHTWMSPPNAKIIAESMYKTIIELDQDNESFYTSNYSRLIQEIDSIHQWLSNQLRDIATREFIIYHPALSYFANDYDLHQISIEQEGKSPSAFYVKQIIDSAKSRNIKIVFIQKQFDQDKAKTIAQEINGKVISIDPLDYYWKDQLITIARAFTENSKEPTNDE